MFIDSAKIFVKAGKGGDGIIAFHREKFKPRGGPSGGDGGKGGDVILFADSQKHTLLDFRYKRRFIAKNGFPGEGSRKSGKQGKSLTIPVPPGTIVIDTNSGEILHDFIRFHMIFKILYDFHRISLDPDSHKKKPDSLTKKLDQNS